MKDGAIDTSYEHTGLEPGTTRHYRVRAKNSEGDGAWSGSVEAETTSGAPGKPLEVMASGSVPGNPASGPTVAAGALVGARGHRGFADHELPGRVVAGRHGRQLGVAERRRTLVGTRSDFDTELPSETTRHYRVFAINDDGTGPASDTVTVTTPDVAAPVPVSASVPAAGTSVAIVFDEALDGTAARLPGGSRFAVTAAAGDGIEIGAVAVSGKTVTVTLHADSPRIRSGQAVTVAYTDRTSGNDAERRGPGR